jgi:hypothetical protein
MNKFIKFYLIILPLIALLGIILSIFRIAFSIDYVQLYILFGTSLDLIIIILGRKYLSKKIILFVFYILMFSVLVGLIQGNEITRRYITDFTNPFFFFCKIYIFKAFWEVNDFKKFIRYYTKIGVIGSLILLPITYYIFSLAGASRMAIFPPMELPFSYFLQSNNVLFLLISFIIIILYGKRAQLVGAMVTLFIFKLYLSRKKLLLNVTLITLSFFLFLLSLKYFSDNLAINRINYTIEQFQDSGTSGVANTRILEVEAILSEMNSVVDFFFGKGIGFTYYYEHTADSSRSNAHFSPLSFISQYGFIFTMFLYYYLIRTIFKKTKKRSSNYNIAAITCIFIFIESFFAYTLFVTPIFPLAFGYLKTRKNE